mmetsp:Transcript_20889/g.58349  ORF Transcript_20889/g.58349 Transcript_20889/m.58349 type:complete len:212 (+) Transcript_20889:358-993(+)
MQSGGDRAPHPAPATFTAKASMNSPLSHCLYVWEADGLPGRSPSATTCLTNRTWPSVVATTRMAARCTPSWVGTTWQMLTLLPSSTRCSTAAGWSTCTSPGMQAAKLRSPFVVAVCTRHSVAWMQTSPIAWRNGALRRMFCCYVGSGSSSFASSRSQRTCSPSGTRFSPTPRPGVASPWRTQRRRLQWVRQQHPSRRAWRFRSPTVWLLRW